MLATNNNGKKPAHFTNALLFSEQSQKALTSVMRWTKVRKGSWLFFEGDSIERLYFLKDGLVKLIKTADDGKEMALYYYQSGDFLGEFAGTRTGSYGFGAIAVRPTTVGIVLMDDLRRLIRENSGLALDLLEWNDYLRRLMQYKLRDLMFYGKEGALASTLIRMANSFGRVEGNVIRLSERFTNREIAEMIHATRETVNRMLRCLKQQGVIKEEQGRLTILDLAYLKEMCHCEGCPLEICRL